MKNGGSQFCVTRNRPDSRANFGAPCISWVAVIGIVFDLSSWDTVVGIVFDLSRSVFVSVSSRGINGLSKSDDFRNSGEFVSRDFAAGANSCQDFDGFGTNIDGDVDNMDDAFNDDIADDSIDFGGHG